jgi:Zn-dependent protease
MGGSYHIATVGGIPVKIHWTFGLLLLYVAYDTSRVKFDFWTIMISIGIVLSVFFCVILHEFGHALAAGKFGVKTYDIVMTPIGGIARLERMPEGRGQEFWVAIAGPVVNFIIVGLIWLGFVLFAGKSLDLFSMSFWRFENQEPSYFIILLLANGYLGTFNLLPAFPMDGGRMLRSLLSLHMTREKSTQIASITGQALALVMLASGAINGQPTMALIGVFIFFAARQENRQLQKQAKFTRSNAGNLMDPPDHRFFLGQTLSAVKDALHQIRGNAFIVWSRPGIPAGYITRQTIDKVDPMHLPGSLIDAWVIPSPFVVSPDTHASQLIQVMQHHRLPIVLVSDPTGYVGTITWEKLESELR